MSRCRKNASLYEACVKKKACIQEANTNFGREEKSKQPRSSATSLCQRGSSSLDRDLQFPIKATPWTSIVSSTTYAPVPTVLSDSRWRWRSINVTICLPVVSWSHVTSNFGLFLMHRVMGLGSGLGSAARTCPAAAGLALDFNVVRYGPS